MNYCIVHMFKGTEKVASNNERAELKNWSTARLGALADTTQGCEEPQNL